jgi:amidase
MHPCESTIFEQSAKLRAGETSSEELTELQLDRIRRYDDRLASYITLTPERALEDARRADAELRSGQDRGPLHGIPLALKDLIDTAGIRTTCASRVLADNVPEADATVARRLAGAGGVLLGKLAMTEFALSGYHEDFRVPINPWDASCWSGVSSSGSGVATAASLCFASLGTDTGGSIRFPAACNGVVGLKPTYGRVSRHGVFPLAASLDHIGPLTRCVFDAAAVFDAISGHDPADATSLPLPPATTTVSLSESVVGCRIGVDRKFIRSETEIEVADAVEAALLDLQRCGAEIVEIECPDVEDAMAAWYTLCAADALHAHRLYADTRRDDYGPTFASLLDLARTFSAVDYASAHEARLMYAGALRSVLAQVDVIACPSVSLATLPVDAVPPDSPVDLATARRGYR